MAWCFRASRRPVFHPAAPCSPTSARHGACCSRTRPCHTSWASPSHGSPGRAGEGGGPLWVEPGARPTVRSQSVRAPDRRSHRKPSARCPARSPGDRTRSRACFRCRRSGNMSAASNPAQSASPRARSRGSGCSGRGAGRPGRPIRARRSDGCAPAGAGRAARSGSQRQTTPVRGGNMRRTPIDAGGASARARSSVQRATAGARSRTPDRSSAARPSALCIAGNAAPGPCCWLSTSSFPYIENDARGDRFR